MLVASLLVPIAAASASTADPRAKPDLASLWEADLRRLSAAEHVGSTAQAVDRTPSTAGVAAEAVRQPPTRAEIAVATALAQLGKPYRTAGKGPDRFDCSGLTGFAWAAAGVPLPPSSRTQYANLPSVPLEELQPGDLVFRGRPIHHVGMYIGNGQMVHSPQTGDVVKISDIDFSRVVGAVRP